MCASTVMTRETPVKAETMRGSPRLDETGKGRAGGSLLALCVAAIIVIVGLAAWLLSQQSGGSIPGFTRVDSGPMLRVASRIPDLVHGITIETKGQLIELRRDGDQWRLASSSGYPVPAGRVAPMIGALGSLRSAYVSTQAPPPYEVFGLKSVDDPTGQAARITIADDEGADIGAITIGTVVSAPGATQRYVTAAMKPGDSRIWLADGNVQILSSPLDWIDNRILTMPRDRFRRLEATAPDGQRLVVTRAEDGTVRLAEGLPPGVEVSEAWLVDEMANVFNEVTFLDVQRLSAFTPQPQETWKVSVLTADRISFHASLTTVDMGTWASFRAEAETGADAGARAAVARFNARHDGWAYLLNDHTAKYLMTQPSALSGKAPRGGSPGSGAAE